MPAFFPVYVSKKQKPVAFDVLDKINPSGTSEPKLTQVFFYFKIRGKAPGTFRWQGTKIQ